GRGVRGRPVWVVAGAVGELGELERLVDRVGRRPAAPDRRLIEDGQERHLVDPLLLASPLLLAQDELLHLPGGGLRQVTELDGGGTFALRDVLAAELDDVWLGRRRAGLERGERLGPLAPRAVRDRDAPAAHHRGRPGDG